MLTNYPWLIPVQSACSSYVNTNTPLVPELLVWTASCTANRTNQQMAATVIDYCSDLLPLFLSMKSTVCQFFHIAPFDTCYQVMFRSDKSSFIASC